MGLGDDLRIGGPLYQHVVSEVAGKNPETGDKFIQAFRQDALMKKASQVPKWSTASARHEDGLRIPEVEREIRFLFVELCIMRVLFYLGCDMFTLIDSNPPMNATTGQEDTTCDAGATRDKRTCLPAPKYSKSGYPSTMAGHLQMTTYLQAILEIPQGSKSALRKLATGCATSCGSNRQTLKTITPVCSCSLYTPLRISQFWK